MTSKTVILEVSLIDFDSFYLCEQHLSVVRLRQSIFSYLLWVFLFVLLGNSPAGETLCNGMIIFCFCCRSLIFLVVLVKEVFSMMIMIKQLFLCCKYYPKAFFFKVAPAHIFLVCNFTWVDIV